MYVEFVQFAALKPLSGRFLHLEAFCSHGPVLMS
jgi:hypothetical protein